MTTPTNLTEIPRLNLQNLEPFKHNDEPLHKRLPPDNRFDRYQPLSPTSPKWKAIQVEEGKEDDQDKKIMDLLRCDTPVEEEKSEQTRT